MPIFVIGRNNHKNISLMKEEEGKKPEKKAKAPKAKAKKRTVSKTWEAMQKLKGSLIVNDPKFLL